MTIQDPGRVRLALVEALLGSLEGPIPGGTERFVHGARGFPRKATAVVGMRRAGKTTYVHQVRRERLASGTPRPRLPYVNFEDERLAGLGMEDLTLLTDELGRRLGGETTGTVWSFDEIQVVPGWERFVRRLLDSGRDEVSVIGSSAAMLSREIGTALRGRAWTVPIYPFSFREALLHAGEEVPSENVAQPAPRRLSLERAFLSWLDAGGFPEAQGLDTATRRQLLQDYVDVAMLRDVVERHGVTNVTSLRWLVRHVLGNPGGSFSVEKFHRALKSQGIPVARDTVHELVAHLEDCFLVRQVWMESESERQRMVNPRKLYPVDSGLGSLFDRTGRSNAGHLLEGAVLVELERRRCDVTYVKTREGFEVDFLARESDGTEHLVQVCADARDAETTERELRALESAGEAHPRARRWLLTLTTDALPHSLPPDVQAVPAYRWMLKNDWT